MRHCRTLRRAELLAHQLQTVCVMVRLEATMGPVRRWFSARRPWGAESAELIYGPCGTDSQRLRFPERLSGPVCGTSGVRRNSQFHPCVWGRVSGLVDECCEASVVQRHGSAVHTTCQRQGRSLSVGAWQVRIGGSQFRRIRGLGRDVI